MSDVPGSPIERAESVDAYRARARRLLKSLRDGDVPTAQRFAVLRGFAGLDPTALREEGRVRLKHALTLLAVEAGHPSWVAFKVALEARLPTLPPMWQSHMGALLNRWFADYEEARASREQEGGFLLPYRNQFFVTETEGIRALGLDPDDPDWERIAWDFVRPADVAAHARLVERRRSALARKV